MASFRPDLSAEEWLRLDGILDEALEVTGIERQRLLEALSPRDAELVGQLLAAGERVDPLSAFESIAQGEPVQIGPWKVGTLLGEGGMSSVYLAHRVDGEMDAEVALKLMRRGPGTLNFERRFRRERQILIGLRHPNIVQVLDGGTTPQGAPYYVMERVHGENWAQWCRGKTLEARVRAMIEVCDAVDYAHQQFVVHCDLKPDNVFVDAEKRPRVLDFGIAKLVNGEGATVTGLRMMTPRWAAPEQIAGEPITVRTDVYGLGLLLWSALTGQSPREDLTGPPLYRAICDQDLPAPSVSASEARGDLDAIVAMATARESEARYRSAGDLAADLRRMLEGRAVVARSASRGYRMWRWVRTHKGAVLAATVGLSLLTGWAVTTTLQNERIERQRVLAEAAAVEAEQNYDLLVQILTAADPARAGSNEVTVRQVLEQATQTIERQDVSPRARAQLLGVVGRVEYALGMVAEAKETLKQAIVALEDTYGPTHESTLEAKVVYQRAIFSEETGRQVVEAMDELSRQAKQAGHDKTYAMAVQTSAELWIGIGEAEVALERVREAAQAHLAVGDAVKAARALAVEGYIINEQGDRDGAIEKFEAAIAQLDGALGTREHPDVVDILAEFALIARGDRALEVSKEAVALRRSIYGRTWNTAVAINNLGLGLEGRGKVEEGIALMREAVEIAEEVMGKDSDEAFSLRRNLAASLAAAGYTEGAKMLRVMMADPDAKPSFIERAEQYMEDYERNRRD